MSQEVTLTIADYRIILSWFDRIFATGSREPTNEDSKAYQKLNVMCSSFIDEMDLIHGKKDNDPQK